MKIAQLSHGFILRPVLLNDPDFTLYEDCPTIAQFCRIATIIVKCAAGYYSPPAVLRPQIPGECISINPTRYSCPTEPQMLPFSLGEVDF